MLAEVHFRRDSDQWIARARAAEQRKLVRRKEQVEKRVGNKGRLKETNTHSSQPPALLVALPKRLSVAYGNTRRIRASGEEVRHP